MPEYAKDAAIVINTLVLVVLLFKYVQDLRRSYIEHGKLRIAILKLEVEIGDQRRRILAASGEDVERHIIRPLREQLDVASRRFEDERRERQVLVSDWKEERRQERHYRRHIGTALYELGRTITQLGGPLPDMRHPSADSLSRQLDSEGDINGPAQVRNEEVEAHV